MGEMSIEEIEELIDSSARLRGEIGFPPDVNNDGFCGCGECRQCLLDCAWQSLDELATALRQLLDAQKWREIETAPKDGSEIWILYPYPILEQKARWVREGPIKDMWVGSRPTWDHDEASGKLVLLPEDEWDHQTFPSSEPTHWMPIVPLPLPPLKEQGEQGDV